jgi:hypothetical protein
MKGTVLIVPVVTAVMLSTFDVLIAFCLNSQGAIILIRDALNASF